MSVRQAFHPYSRIVRAIWENRHRPLYAWRILRDGVCDGCALGTSGLRDWTMPGVHLCWIRLSLLSLNTLPPMNPEILSNIHSLPDSERALRSLGRLSHPMIRRRGERGFSKISWEDALELMASRIKDTSPDRLAFYLVSRGTLNETYFVAQKVARFLGTNNIDNSARVCHAASTTGLRQAIGYAAATCSYRDWIGTDLLVFWGSDAANNQPVTMKYVHMARKAGTRVVVVNPFKEPSMKRYYVPSIPSSAIVGTKIADEFFSVRPGGDIAFVCGVLKCLIEFNALDHDFIQNHTVGWPELVAKLETYSFEELERASGVPISEMARFARLYAEAKTAVFVWSMGLTMHRFGTDNVRAIASLALARGMIGRPNCGLVPIRGHSGVQGGAEMGAVPNRFPGGLPVNEDNAKKFSELWGFSVPSTPGFYITEVIERAHEGAIDVLYSVGGNLVDILPDRSYTRRALARIPLRIHHDIVVNPQMLIDPADTVLLLPATTRYEVQGGGTETTTERRVIFNPEIPGPRIPEARDEWRVLMDVACRVRPDLEDRIRYRSTADIREDIARSIPVYEPIKGLKRKGDQFQWGGPRLCEAGRFATPDGKAHFSILEIPDAGEDDESLFLVTRRGDQFNSLLFSGNDPATGWPRDAVVLHPSDIKKMGLRPGMKVHVISPAGKRQARVFAGEITPGSAIMFWPEANDLIPVGIRDEACGIPAYRDVRIRLEPLE